MSTRDWIFHVSWPNERNFPSPNSHVINRLDHVTHRRELFVRATYSLGHVINLYNTNNLASYTSFSFQGIYIPPLLKEKHRVWTELNWTELNWTEIEWNWIENQIQSSVGHRVRDPTPRTRPKTPVSPRPRAPQLAQGSGSGSDMTWPPRPPRGPMSNPCPNPRVGRAPSSDSTQPNPTGHP